MSDWDEFEWVVWRINVDDPQQRAGHEPDLAERTKGPMTELAASVGCVYEECCDDDSSEDDVPYYACVGPPARGRARPSEPDRHPAGRREAA
jgi:hypothetical protein